MSDLSPEAETLLRRISDHWTTRYPVRRRETAACAELARAHLVEVVQRPGDSVRHRFVRLAAR